MIAFPERGGTGRLAGLVLATLLLATLSGGAQAAEEGDDPHEDLAAVGAELSNPIGNIWALFTEFDVSFFDGNGQRGNDKPGSATLFQPILPLPLYGDDWKLITRPTIPFVWTQPRGDGPDKTNYDTGIGDTFLPLLVSPPLGQNWIVGLGPTFTLPTSTNDALGRQQWQLGPAAVLGYKTKDYVFGVFPQYFWKIASRGDKNNEVRNASNMSLLYFAFLNLPDAWQVGFNPSITYDYQADSGNRWNVPIGLLVTKTTKFGKMPVKFQVGAEYSVVSQDDYGKRALLKLNIIPVIPSLVQSPLLGGS